MKICHELTPQLFGGFDKKNDYDFILPRFWGKNREYKEHYNKSKKFKILDNGLFEGDEYTVPEFVQLINEVQPDIFVVPDVWNDASLTFRNAKYWYNTIKPQLPTSTQLMVVMQGKTLEDFEFLYQECEDLGYRNFAFNFSSQCYDKLMVGHSNQLIRQMLGRIRVISHLKAAQHIQDTHYLHLLGCSLPNEFLYYPKDWKFLRSVDTSNPIINGAMGIQYNEWGLLTKPREKMEEFFDKDLSSTISLINYNVDKFREFVEK